MDSGMFFILDNGIAKEEVNLLSKQLKKSFKKKNGIRIDLKTDKNRSVSFTPTLRQHENNKDELPVCSSRPEQLINGKQTSSKSQKQKRKPICGESADLSRKVRVVEQSKSGLCSHYCHETRKRTTKGGTLNSSNQVNKNSCDRCSSSNRTSSLRVTVSRNFETFDQNHNRQRRESCLTRCRSCSEYVLPELSETDNMEMANYVALDCEFVGVGPKKLSALGRCSIVDHRGVLLFDRFVKPPERITDYRTRWSGLRHRDIMRGIPLVAAQQQITEILRRKVVVGHAVHNDFRVMGVSHPVQDIRDTSGCRLLREMAQLNLQGASCALHKLTKALLGRTIQKREHCSVTDARACLDLFRLVRTQWEPSLLEKQERRRARNGNVETQTGSAQTDSHTNEPPSLVSYLDDQYWPENMFVDYHE